MLKRLQSFFQPQENWVFKEPIQFQRQRQFQALWIGLIAFMMPALLFYSNATAACFRDTISHTYYTPIWGDIFVAMATGVGILLMFYRGQSQPERWLAVIGGLAAIIVALVPTTGSGCELAYAPSRIFVFADTDKVLADAFEPGKGFSSVHGVAAGVLFSMLTIFSLFVFTATDNTNAFQRRMDNRNKRIRNTVYRITGVVMLATLLSLAMNKFFGFPDCDIFNPTLGIGQPELECKDDGLFTSPIWDRHNLTFYFEWAALASFGAAWFVKGRGGGFLLLDETPDKIISKPWWWPT